MHEVKEDNGLFFTCSLIEYIARKTKNTKKAIVQLLGKETLQKYTILQKFIIQSQLKKYVMN